MGLVSELKRRNVFRMAVLYLVAAWLIMQVAEVLSALLPGFLPERFGQVTLGILAVGFPIALVLSWFTKVTAAGISLEKDVDAGESTTHITGRRLDFIVISLLSAAVVLFAVHTWWIPEPPERSVAVLPFVPMSSGEDDGYFADGLTEEILNGLAQLPDLRVTARTSSFFFKGQDIPVPEIADRLNVAHIVEGSVRRDGERLRITSQLIRAADGFHLWSQTYDRTVNDIFAVQQDIAEKIAEALNVVLDDNARQRMRNVGIRDVEAFIAYQKGLEAYNKAHEVHDYTNGLAIANVYFDRALEAVPGLTAARLMKADSVGHNLQNIAAGARDEEYPGEAQDVLTALREEYNLAWRLSQPGNQRDILDLERTLFSNDWSRLPAKIKKAMQPGECTKLNWTADVIPQFGWAEQVAAKSREALACDPMEPNANAILVWSLIWAGDAEGALQGIEQAENRGVTVGLWDRYKALLAAGRVSDAMAMALPGNIGTPSVMQIRRETLVGDTAMARQMATEYWSKPNVGYWSSLAVAASVGDREKANEMAALIDTFPGSAVVLSVINSTCFCGAMFDLDAAPNYKARIEEAGFPWPPPKRIDFPTKTW